MEYSRNISNFAFPTLLTKEKRITLENQIKEAFNSNKNALPGNYISFKEDDEVIKKILRENYIFFNKIESFLVKTDSKKGKFLLI